MRFVDHVFQCIVIHMKNKLVSQEVVTKFLYWDNYIQSFTFNHNIIPLPCTNWRLTKYIRWWWQFSSIWLKTNPIVTLDALTYIWIVLQVGEINVGRDTSFHTTKSYNLHMNLLLPNVHITYKTNWSSLSSSLSLNLLPITKLSLQI